MILTGVKSLYVLLIILIVTYWEFSSDFDQSNCELRAMRVNDVSNWS